MTDIVTGNQIDIAAFDSGMSSPRLLPSDPNYRGPSPDEGRAKYDLASEAAMFGGIFKAVTNPIGTGLRALEGYGIATSTDEERAKDTMLESSIQKLNTMGNPIERTKNIVRGGKQVLKDVDNFINPKLAWEAVPVEDVSMGIRKTKDKVDLTNSQPLQVISNATKKTSRYKKWVAAGDQWYKDNLDKGDPMAGFERFTDTDGKVYRRTTSGRIPGTNMRKLTNQDIYKKRGNLKDRKITEEGWENDLKDALDEFGLSDRFDEFSKEIKSSKKVQDQRRTKLNKSLTKRGVTDRSKHFTIQHSGALKKGWPDISDNRWGLQNRASNSADGALRDPPSKNIRYSGTSKSMSEWVVKRMLQENGLDLTSDLPVAVRRKIRDAYKINKKSGEQTVNLDKINDILHDHFTKTDMKIKSSNSKVKLSR